MSTGKVSNQCEYRKVVESVRVPRKGKIPASIEKLFGWVPEKGSNQCEYRKMEESEWVPEKVESVRVSKNYSDDYRKSVQSVWVPKNGRIRASTRKRKNPCEYGKTVRVSNGKGSNQCEYRKNEESGWVRRKSRICSSIEKLFGWVPKKCPISVSTGKRKDPWECREIVRLSTWKGSNQS